MIKEKIHIENIPAIIWGEKSDKVYLFVHGKMSNKESAKVFAEIAASKHYQTISFDLPEHSEHSFMGKEDGEIIRRWMKDNCL